MRERFFKTSDRVWVGSSRVLVGFGIFWILDFFPDFQAGSKKPFEALNHPNFIQIFSGFRGCGSKKPFDAASGC